MDGEPERPATEGADAIGERRVGREGGRGQYGATEGVGEEAGGGEEGE